MRSLQRNIDKCNVTLKNEDQSYIAKTLFIPDHIFH